MGGCVGEWGCREWGDIQERGDLQESGVHTGKWGLYRGMRGRYIEEWGKTHPLTSFPKEKLKADECHFYKMEIYTQNLSTLF